MRCVAKTFVMSEGPPWLAFLAVLSEMSWSLHPWGLVFSATIGGALKDARECPTDFARARCEGFAFFPPFACEAVRARVNRPIARAHFSTSAADIVMIAGVH